MLFGSSGSLKYFAAFFKHYIVRIQDAHIQRIAHFVLSENIWPADLIDSFCNAVIGTRKVKEIFDEDIFQRLVHRVEQKKEWTMGLPNVIPFFSLLKLPQQQKLNKIIEDEYKQQHSNQRDLFVQAYIWQMWNPSTNKVMCDEHLEYIALHGDPHDYIVMDNGRPEMDNFSLWNSIIFAMHMIYSYDLFEDTVVVKIGHKVETPMFKWILNPESFDYNQFDVCWILVFKDPAFVARLKKVAALQEAVETGLRMKYNSSVAALFYTEYRSI